MFERFKQSLQQSRRRRILFFIGLLALVEVVLFAVLGAAGAVHAQSDDNYLNQIENGNLWQPLVSVYSDVMGQGLFFGAMVLLPAGMAYIKLRNVYPPAIILILGSAIFGTLIDTMSVRMFMIALLSFGVGIVLYRTFSKGQGY